MRDEDFETRAAERRKRWRGGVAHSHADMAARDLEFWAAATPEERLAAVFELMEQLRLLGGNDGTAPRLDRSVGGVRPRKG